MYWNLQYRYHGFEEQSFHIRNYLYHNQHVENYTLMVADYFFQYTNGELRLKYQANRLPQDQCGDLHKIFIIKNRMSLIIRELLGLDEKYGGR